MIVRPNMDVINNIPNTYIASSDLHGDGLFTEITRKKGDLLGILDGQEVDWDYYHRLRDALPFAEDVKNCFFFEWNALPMNRLLARAYQTKYSYINHSREPNLLLEPTRRFIKIVAGRNIKENEELTLDYRKEPLNDEYLNGHGSTYL